MEQIYAFGVSCIEFIQYWLKDSQTYLELVNDVSNPHHMTEMLFPLVSIVDSVFAAQLLLCMAFGGWLNAVMKWWLLEDRPYWWVRETSFYSGNRRPQLRQFRQTCETGPGCPSGHTAAAAMLLVLALMWISHVMHDRKFYIWWWKYLVYPLFGMALGSVMLARMFVATHFPHQCLMGAVIGSILAPALCIYVSDPFVWRYGYHARCDAGRAVAWHALCAAIAVAIAAVTYLSLVLCGWDPHWTVKLIETRLRSSRQQELRTVPQSNYRWLMAKNIRPVNVDGDLEKLKPLIRKMTSENCAAIAVKLDNLTDNWSTDKIISTLRNLLEEQYSIQLMAGNVKRAKESKNKINKVRPLLTEGRRATVMFMLHV